jgi:hypothetical protein
VIILNETDIHSQVEEEIKLLNEIRKKMNIIEKWNVEDARAIYQRIQVREYTEQHTAKKQSYCETKYDFTEQKGHATNKQLSFIQYLRKQANEGEMSISITVDNVLKLTVEEADNEIKRLKDKLNWKDREHPAKE